MWLFVQLVELAAILALILLGVAMLWFMFTVTDAVAFTALRLISAVLRLVVAGFRRMFEYWMDMWANDWRNWTSPSPTRTALVTPRKSL